MNIIKCANWHISFRDNVIEALPLTEKVTVPESHLVWNYANDDEPVTNDITIGRCKVRDVLIDMGCSGAFLLTQKALNNINDQVLLKEVASTCSKGFGEEKKIRIYTCDTIEICNVPCTQASFGQSERNIVGLNFMKQFDHLFWDSRHKKVYLWNEEEK